MKTLYVIASPRAERSKSIELGNYATEKLGGEVLTLDVFREPMPFLSEAVIAYNYWFGTYESLSVEDRYIVDLQKKYIAQLKNVDNLVIAVPMWNFWAPAALKAWFDLIIRVNDTFSMDSAGYHGHVNNIKKAVVVGARWGKYINTPYAPYDHLSDAITGILGFIGVDSKNFWLEWVNMLSWEQMDEEISSLKNQIDEYIK